MHRYLLGCAGRPVIHADTKSFLWKMIPYARPAVKKKHGRRSRYASCGDASR
jgi:hypothetical protein